MIHQITRIFNLSFLQSFIYFVYYLFIYLFIYLHLPHKTNITERKWKNISIITKIALLY